MSMKNTKFTGLFTRKKAVRYLIYVLFVCAFAVFVIKLNQVEKTELVVRTGQTFEKAKVVKILQDNLEENGTRVGEQKVRVRMLTGVRKGEELDITSSSGYLFGAACKPGMKVIVMQSVAGDSTVASVYTQDREGVIYIFALIYLLVLCLIGGKQGIKGCLGLVFTFFCVIFVYLPLVYLKYSPFWTAVFVCFITTLVTMYLIGGPTRKTCAATLGTLVGVILAGVSAWCFSKASGISGYNVSDIETLMTLWNTNRIQVGGLLFSGLLISCLGAVMDVAMSISSAIDEIYRQNLSLSRKELFTAGLRVGRDMMGTMTNTLILAFTGGSINTLVFIFAYNYEYQQVINMYSVGIEIMQGLSSSLGVIMAVPVTSWIAAFLYSKNQK